MITATPVTQRVPIKNGQNPNNPFMGFQAEENNSVPIDSLDKIGQALMNNPAATKKTTNPDASARTIMV